MIVDLEEKAPIIIKQEPYLEYEYQTDIGGAKVLFNDASLSYNHLTAIQVRDHLLSFSLDNASPTSTITGKTFVIYPDVFPGIDLFYDLKNDQLKEGLAIQGPDKQHEFSFTLNQSDNLIATLQDDNSIIYTDSEGSIVWTIEAPYSTDANNNPVETYLQFNGSNYVVGIIPGADTAYPIILDPTFTFPYASNAWSYSSATAVTCTPYRFTVGRGDGSRLISSLTVKGTRFYSSANYYNNSNSYSYIYYQWFDKDNVAITGVMDLVVDSSTLLATLEAPLNAYTIEFTGSKKSGTSGTGNTLALITAEYSGSSSNWNFTQNKMVYSPAAIRCRIPDTAFNSYSDGVIVTKTFDSPIGSTFTAGTYSVVSTRGGYSYITACKVSLYSIDGTLISNTTINYPTTAGTVNAYTMRSTALNVPTGIARIVLVGTTYSSSTSSLEIPTVTLDINTATNEYGTAKYSLVLDKNVDAIPISAGFSPKPPASEHKTFVSYTGDIPGDYVESATVTALSGATVYIKVAFTADETANSTLCTNICLAASTYTSVVITFDAKRRAGKSDTNMVNTKRKSANSAIVASDTSKTIHASRNEHADVTRSTCAKVTSLYDTRRVMSVLYSAITNLDTLRHVIKNISSIADTGRKIMANHLLTADMKRRSAAHQISTNDSLRKAVNNTSAMTDTKRSTIKSVAAQIDVLRKTVLNYLLASDTKRKSATNQVTVNDSIRKTAKQSSTVADTKRSTVKAIMNIFDAKRALHIDVYMAADTKRSIRQVLQGLVTVDTIRTVIHSISQNSDLTRSVITQSSDSFDVKLRNAISNAATANTARKLANSTLNQYDVGRKNVIRNISTLDTNRKTVSFIHVEYDTNRLVGAPISLYYDTKRKIADRKWARIKRVQIVVQVEDREVNILSYTE